MNPSSSKRRAKNMPSPVPSTSTSPASVVYQQHIICKECNVSLSDFESFRVHLATHLDDNGAGSMDISLQITDGNRVTFANPDRSEYLYKCPYCDKTYEFLATCDRHVPSHFLDTKYIYSCHCNERFEEKEELQKHFWQTHSTHYFRCTICDYTTRTEQRVKEHSLLLHCTPIEKYQCRLCPEMFFRTEADCHIHFHEVHFSLIHCSVLREERLPHCNICKQVIRSEEEMILHRHKEIVLRK